MTNFILIFIAGAILIAIGIYTCFVNSKIRETQYIKIKPNIPPMPPVRTATPTWKLENWPMLLDKIEDITLFDNNEMLIEDYVDKNISEKTRILFTKLKNNPNDVTFEDIYYFAEEYGVSIDYLLGRSDKEML